VEHQRLEARRKSIPKKRSITSIHRRHGRDQNSKDPVDILDKRRRSSKCGAHRPLPSLGPPTCPAEEAHVALAPSCRYLAPRIVSRAHPRNGRTGTANCFDFVLCLCGHGCALTCSRNRILLDTPSWRQTNKI
jgi:hypothetical protein